jgi:HAD superfamily hydrolase (TIGR01509 family)
MPQALVPGVAAFLERQQDRPMAVGSNAEPANIDFVLDRAGLRHHFRALVDGHQVERPKPHPDIYLRAAALLGVPPDACIVFEDSPTGIAAGVAAGMRVVAVNTLGLPAFEGVDLVIDDFRSPALDRWLSTPPPPRA